ncbi:cold shock domain-containing protein [Paenibacillus rhizoplanae]
MFVLPGKKAFGFVKVRDLPDHFFHISALSDDSDTLYMTAGDRVQIEVGTDKNGRPCATFVKLVD